MKEPAKFAYAYEKRLELLGIYSTNTAALKSLIYKIINTTVLCSRSPCLAPITYILAQHTEPLSDCASFNSSEISKFFGDQVRNPAHTSERL